MNVDVPSTEFEEVPRSSFQFFHLANLTNLNVKLEN